MKKFSFLSAILPLLILVGCSVKEGRDGCPCRLFLDMTSVDKLEQSPFTIYILSDDGFEFSAVLDYENVQDTCIVDVPKTALYVVVWSGVHSYMDDGGLTIPLGQDCPPVYIYSAELDADGEAVYDVVSLKKNYCILNVSVEDPNEVESMVVRGGVAGFDVLGKPLYGEFSVLGQMQGIVPSSCFNIPRQDGSPLYLDVTENNGKVRTFPLHDYISEFGYDWSDPDLEDLNMILNYTPVGVTITIRSWDEELTIDVVI